MVRGTYLYNYLLSFIPVELLATIWATIITLLEDDENTIRQRVSNALDPSEVTPSKSCEMALKLMQHVGDRPLNTVMDHKMLFALIALLDFQSVVVMADDVSDEVKILLYFFFGFRSQRVKPGT